MPLNIADLERRVKETSDLAAIPGMTPEERATLLAQYTSRRDELATRAEQTRDVTLRQTGGQPDYRAVRGLSKAIRQYRSAQLSLERLQKEIVKAERTEPTDRPLLSAQGIPNGLETECHSKRARTKSTQVYTYKKGVRRRTIRQKSDTNKKARVRR